MNIDQKSIWSLICEPAIRSFKLLANPFIINNEGKENKDLKYAPYDFLYMLIGMFGVISFITSLFNNYLKVDTATLNNVWFKFLTGISAVKFCAILYLFSLLVLLLKKKGHHIQIFLQGLRSFSLLIILTPILLLTFINRSIEISELTTPINDFDFWFFYTVFSICILVFIWTLVVPLLAYISLFYRKRVAVILLVFIFGFTYTVHSKSPFPFGNSNMIDKAKYCEQWVKSRVLLLTLFNGGYLI